MESFWYCFPTIALINVYIFSEQDDTLMDLIKKTFQLGSCDVVSVAITSNN